jgi:hypothetical protein
MPPRDPTYNPHDPPIEPYVGPTSLDALIDQLRDPWADEAPAGDPSLVCRRPARAPQPAAPSARSRREQGAIDRRKLQAAIDDPECPEKARCDFEDMLSRIHPDFGEYESLTDRQRGYVDGVLQELGIDERDPAERNASVPRGREVDLKLGPRPLAPPGRGRSSW